MFGWSDSASRPVHGKRVGSCFLASSFCLKVICVLSIIVTPSRNDGYLGKKTKKAGNRHFKLYFKAFGNFF